MFIGALSELEYTSLWKKYRPAVLKLMKEASNSPQEYTFQSHEFKDINPKQKGGYTFTLTFFEGKATNLIKESVIAKALLMILQRSDTAVELSGKNVYELTMDKQFVLHVSQEEAPLEEEQEEEKEDQ